MKLAALLASFLLFAIQPTPADAGCEDMDCTCKSYDVYCKLHTKPRCEAAKLACQAGEKVVKETGNAFEDFRKLVETGKCGGDICDALDAAKNFSVDQVKDTNESLSKAGERLREGKPIDALWHLQTDQLNNSQENAAEAAKRSQLLRSTGQIAAGAYGGPGGAAAYAAWLTYSETKQLGLALKTGLITGVTSYASEFANTVGGDIALRTVMSGAIAGTAVAAAGGKKEDIEQAVARGALSMLIREGYREMTDYKLDRNMLKSSQGKAYCLEADPNSGLDCLPPKNAYIRDARGQIVKNAKGKPQVDVRKLEPSRPHVGMATSAPDGGFLGATETSQTMTTVSRLPGWNAMAFAHDVFASKTPGISTAIDMGYVVGTIPPFVVLTYEGAGGGVHDMIRGAAVKQGAAASPAERSGSQDIAPHPAGSAPSSPSTVREMTHMICRKSNQTKVFLMDSSLAPGGRVDNEAGVCRIDQLLGQRWVKLWHAHHQPHTCVVEINSIVEHQKKMGYRCVASLGLQQDAVQSAR
jgi:hypothetical protein